MNQYKVKQIETLEVSKEPIESVSIISDAAAPLELLVSHRGKGISVYSVSSGHVDDETKIIRSYTGFGKPVRDSVYCPIGNKIISGSNEVLNITDKETGKTKSFTGHTRNIKCVSINKENNKIVTGSEDCSFILWNVMGEQVAKFGRQTQSHFGWINAVKFIPDTDDLIASGSEDGTVKFWNINDTIPVKIFLEGKLVLEDKLKDCPELLNNTDNAVKALSFTGDGTFMIYGGRNGRIYVINIRHNEVFFTHELPDRVLNISCSDISPCFAVAIPQKVMIFNMMTSDKLLEFTYSDNPNNYSQDIAFKGNQLFVGTYDGKVQRFEISLL